MRKFPPRLAIRNVFPSFALASLIVCLAVGAIAQSQDQTDWHQWTAKDVHEILFKSPWVSNCCRDWDTGPYQHDGPTVGGPADLGYSASIVSSLTVRQALVRRMELDKRYETLDSTARKDVDQELANCLNQKFSNYIVLSFSFFGPSQDPAVNPAKFLLTKIHILTSDGRRITGNQVTKPVAESCGGFTRDSDLSSLGIYGWSLYGPGHEVAFPRVVDGKPTIGPNDKTIRIDLDFYKDMWPRHSVGEIDFTIDKLIYQGKPDF